MACALGVLQGCSGADAVAPLSQQKPPVAPPISGTNTVPLVPRLAQFSPDTLVSGAAVAAPPAIDAGRILQDIKVLSSDEYEGRGPATPGETRTVAYLIAQMKAAGLQPAGDPLKGGGRAWTQDVPHLSPEQRKSFAKLEQIKIARPHFLALGLDILPSDLADDYRAKGLPVMAWTVRKPEQWEALKDHCDNLIFEGFAA